MTVPLSSILCNFFLQNHYGSLGGGHYTAYAKSRNDSTWFEFDDQQVKTVGDTSQIISTAAYVLFYKRKDVTFNSFTETGSSDSDGGDKDKKEGEGAGNEVEMKNNMIVDEYEEPSDAEDGEPAPAVGGVGDTEMKSEETQIPEADLNN